jgi:regulator of sigma E protease
MEWIVVVIVFSALIFVHEFGHFVMALRSGIKVEVFSLGMGPKVVSIVKNGIEYRISAIPIGGYVKMAGEDPSEKREGKPWEFLSASIGNRFRVGIAGSLVNYVFGLILFIAVFLVGYPVTTTVESVLDKYPAKEAGIQGGDRIIAIDGTPVRNLMMAMDMIKSRTEGTVKLTIKRQDSSMDMEFKPVVEEGLDIFGNKAKVAKIGITFSNKPVYKKFGIGESVALALNETFWTTKFTYRTIWSMFAGRVKVKEVAGPTGIIVITAAAAKAGLSMLLYITALISVSLAIFNLLPFPPLDGGLVLFLAIEKLRGKPLSFKTQERIMRAGWTLIIIFLLFVTYNDFFRFILKR